MAIIHAMMEVGMERALYYPTSSSNFALFKKSCPATEPYTIFLSPTLRQNFKPPEWGLTPHTHLL